MLIYNLYTLVWFYIIHTCINFFICTWICKLCESNRTSVLQEQDSHVSHSNRPSTECHECDQPARWPSFLSRYQRWSWEAAHPFPRFWHLSSYRLWDWWTASPFAVDTWDLKQSATNKIRFLILQTLGVFLNIWIIKI